MNYEDVQQAVAAVADATASRRHEVAVVLGSGLSSYADREDATTVAYDAIPGFPVPDVEGHAGSLVSVDVGGQPTLILAGRVHAYEGWSMDEVVFGVRVAIAAGAAIVVLTNAAGSINTELRPGSLVNIADHINLTGLNPLTGPNDERLGPRFPDMSEVYAGRLRQVTRVAASDANVDVGEGTYAWFTGPSYETPAEIVMARTMGADLVGMSTVPEAIAARHMGARVVGISLVTNLAAGISEVELSHSEVQETAAAAAGRFAKLLDVLIPRLGAEL